MTAFSVGDKVTHPLTGDNVLTVVATSAYHGAPPWIKADVNPLVSVFGLIRPPAEFTPYTPPRVSTQELANRVAQAYYELTSSGDMLHAMKPAQALAEAATAYAERLEEESR